MKCEDYGKGTMGTKHFRGSVCITVPILVYYGCSNNATVELVMPRIVRVTSNWLLASLGIEFLVRHPAQDNTYKQAKLIS